MRFELIIAPIAMLSSPKGLRYVRCTFSGTQWEYYFNILPKILSVLFNSSDIYFKSILIFSKLFFIGSSFESINKDSSFLSIFMRRVQVTILSGCYTNLSLANWYNTSLSTLRGTGRYDSTTSGFSGQRSTY